jgi:hypothetical protein
LCAFSPRDNTTQQTAAALLPRTTALPPNNSGSTAKQQQQQQQQRHYATYYTSLLPCCPTTTIKMPAVTWPDFEVIGFAIMHREHNRSSDKSRMHRFVSWFGAEPIYLSITWNKLVKSGWLKNAGREAKPEHLVWAFMWLKCYSTTEIHSAQACVDEKSFRDKVWFYVEGIAHLDKSVVS